MDQQSGVRALTRRRFLASVAVANAVALLAACGGTSGTTTTSSAPSAASSAASSQAAPATSASSAASSAAPVASSAAPASSSAAASTSAAASSSAAATSSAAQAASTSAASSPAASAAKVADVARNRTLVLMWAGTQGRYVDFDLWNPFAPTANHQNGLGILHEPLAYYSAFADQEFPWLAESYKYSPDFKQLTIKTRSGITWSDGQPFSAEDVAFTFNGLRDRGAKVKWGVNIQQFVQQATATDASTVVVDFKVPAPRFFSFVTYKYDIGVQIIPKHIYENVADWAAFKNFDIAKGLPVTTGPWKVVFASPEQKIIDRRSDWWAAAAGLAQLPKVERVVYLPFAGETQTAQAVITNQIDASLDLRPETIKTVLDKNPSITTHTGNKPPFGYQDWWPTSLYVNNTAKPWDDPDVRWALSYYVDRQQIIDVAYGGASIPSPLPMPQYKPLLPYFDTVKDLLQQYPTNTTDAPKADGLLQKKGWKKGSNGMWNDAAGNPVKLEILGFDVFADVGPVLAQQLKKHGIDANYAQPPDAVDRFTSGKYTGSLFGHGGSVRDPYDTLALYTTSSLAAPGQHLSNFPLWSNPDFDKVADEVYSTPIEDTAKLKELFRNAMKIWLPNLPDIQIDEWYHRIPMNQTYWKNWPTEQNPYVNGAFWHLTFQLILNKLEPAQ